jgi:tRNA threonylcarbamoyladenosine biosynthesis protein TsaB
MYSLLLDSSNSGLAVAFAEDHQISVESSYDAWQQQSELLVAEIDKLMINNNITRDQISKICVCKGPGSYTGIRIALSIAKVMAFALNVPLYLCSSLEMMKDPAHPTICVVNARSKRSYIGVFDGDKTILSDQIMDNTAVLAYIADHKDYVLSGDLTHLNLKGKSIDILTNLNHADVERNLCQEPLAAKPVYLKDNYPV